MFHTPSVTGHRQSSAERRSVEMQKHKVMKFPPLKSVLPAHVEELTGVAQGMLKHFWRAHKKFVQWAPIGQGFSGGGD